MAAPIRRSRVCNRLVSRADGLSTTAMRPQYRLLGYSDRCRLTLISFVH
jgi:hypothetical protein